MLTAHSVLNVAEQPPNDFLLTDDFRGEDRRPLSLSPVLDKDAWEQNAKATWELGTGRPVFKVREIVAVRGDAIAALDYWMDMADGAGVIDGIMCLVLDRSLRRARRIVMLDRNDREGALALLDQWDTDGSGED